jgi:hypothetical protein
MKADDAKKLKELENLALREIAEGNGEPVATTPGRPHAL